MAVLKLTHLRGRRAGSEGMARLDMRPAGIAKQDRVV